MRRTPLAGALGVVAALALPHEVALAGAYRAAAFERPPAMLPAVMLVDQFDRRTRLTQPPDAPVVVVVSDREGSEAAGRWDRELRTARAASTVHAGRSVRLLSVADLRGAPRLLRGIIRRAMPRDTAARVLLDWDGALGRSVRGTQAHLVAAAYGRDGRLRRWEALPLAGTSAALAQALVRAAAQP